ncbi:MAG: hypothetical protein Q9M24_07270 [Mariprofundaceae bacterium]|nr:hypothetical protein [Mariprofundaceae bacterium]
MHAIRHKAGISSSSDINSIAEFGKRNIRHLHRQVDMITHQTKSMHAMAEPLYSLLNKKEQPVAIL